MGSLCKDCTPPVRVGTERGRDDRIGGEESESRSRFLLGDLCALTNLSRNDIRVCRGAETPVEVFS